MAQDIHPTDVIRYYEYSLAALDLVRRSPASAFVATSKFFGLIPKEREDVLEEMRAELDHEVSLALMASIEAIIKTDFKERCKKVKQPKQVRKDFRQLKKASPRGVKLREILTVWQRFVMSKPAVFTVFREYLQVRHWLAHG